MVEFYNRPMDRILLIIDEVQFLQHIEKTLRKVGYRVESLQSEYNVRETLLGFNPDAIVVKGLTHRIDISKLLLKIRDQFKFSGHIVTITNNTIKNHKSDIILPESSTGLRIAMNLINFDTSDDRANKKEKLMKMAQNDVQFKKEEESFLVKYAVDYNQEVINVQNQSEPLVKTPQQKIELYNKQIEDLDVDLKKGLSKRQTKAKSNRGLVTELSKEVDLERKEFVDALFRKDK